MQYTVGYYWACKKEMKVNESQSIDLFSIITMIGYGDLVPRTEGGKIACIVYACFGIPVYILYFMNMGKVRSGAFLSLLTIH